jgi:hypothetical protein
LGSRGKGKEFITTIKHFAMKKIKYSSILPPDGYWSTKERHLHADWEKVGMNDVVELTNIFSNRVTYWKVIHDTALARAKELGGRLQWRMPDENNWDIESFIEFRIVPMDEVSKRATLFPAAATNPTTPGHRGSYYGPDEGVIPMPGWNLISIPQRYTQDELSNRKVNDKWYDL